MISINYDTNYASYVLRFSSNELDTDSAVTPQRQPLDIRGWVNQYLYLSCTIR